MPFTQYRLQELTESNSVVLTVSFKGVRNQPNSTRKLQLTWDEQTPQLRYPPVQASIITEWAACGIACAVLPVYTDFRLSRVTVKGERFDYWLDNGRSLCGLEISGLMQGNLLHRVRTKQDQLLSNPYNVGGFVCIVHFGKATVHLSFYGG